MDDLLALLFLLLNCICFDRLRIYLRFVNALGRILLLQIVMQLKKAKPSNGLTQRALPVLLAEKGMQSEAQGAGGDI